MYQQKPEDKIALIEAKWILLSSLDYSTWDIYDLSLASFLVS